jgi:starch-binding outer membrane protein, SusD/RagB family
MTIQMFKYGKHRIKPLYVFLLPILFIYTNCKKAIEVNSPKTNLNSGNVYNTDATAAAVLTNMYAEMSSKNISITGSDITSISLYTGVGADELALYNLNHPNLSAFYRNDLNKTSQPNYWNSIYSQIFLINSAIEGLNTNIKLTPSVKFQLLGEAKFLRAFSYFYLVNLYGDVPLVLSTDWTLNALLGQTSTIQIYDQMIADLISAQSLLSDKYLKGDALTPYEAGAQERVRPTIWAATALLSRVYLYIGDWINAELEATRVISNSGLFKLESLKNVFTKNNNEAIWQLQPVGNNSNSNTGEGKLFVLPNGGPNTGNNPVYLSGNLLTSFELNDQRAELGNWINKIIVGTNTYYYPYKYKVGNVITSTKEYPTIFRLAEQLLIRAEARAQLNKVSDALADLNTVRSRAGLPAANAAIDKPSLLLAILRERQVELFTEWGHRWFDLKRTGKIDGVMTVATSKKVSGATWRPFQALYPIAEYEIDKNPNLQQNYGY